MKPERYVLFKESYPKGWLKDKKPETPPVQTGETVTSLRLQPVKPDAVKVRENLIQRAGREFRIL